MRRTALMFVLAGLVGALVATPVAVYASHQFTDVPDSNPFHGDIDWLADSGVTRGCGTNIYCPKDNVTREQMAAFMKRLAEAEVVDAGMLEGQTANDFLQSRQVLAGSVQRDASDFTGDITGVVWNGLNYVVEFANVELGECSGVATPGVSPDTTSQFSVSLPSVILAPGAASSDEAAVSFRDSNDFFVTQTAFHLVIVCP